MTSGSEWRSPSLFELVEILQEEVAAAVPGTKLPAVVKVATAFSVSASHAASAYRILRSRGLVVSVHGRGTFVPDPDGVIAVGRPSLREPGPQVKSAVVAIQHLMRETGPGGRLPPTPEMESILGHKRRTIQRALTALELDGLIGPGLSGRPGRAGRKVLRLPV